jgi:segregation and condensation protein A
MIETFEITLPKYAGPFELLLQAVREGRIGIFEISLSQITAAYFEYLKRFSEVNLNLASEFLVMAAYLLELKSKQLLPQPEEIEMAAEEEEIERELARHLAEYKLFKQAAEQLKDKKDSFARIYSRYHREVLGPEDKDFFLTDVNLQDLLQAFQRVYLEFSKEEEVREIKDEEITLPQRIGEVVEMLKLAQNDVAFERLFVRRTRLEAVVTFLAILELCRRQLIRILQGEIFSGIVIRLIPA